jgi:hypothetical protein
MSQTVLLRPGGEEIDHATRVDEASPQFIANLRFHVRTREKFYEPISRDRDPRTHEFSGGEPLGSGRGLRL